MSDVIGNNNVIHNGKNGYVCNMDNRMGLVGGSYSSKESVL